MLWKASPTNHRNPLLQIGAALYGLFLTILLVCYNGIIRDLTHIVWYISFLFPQFLWLLLWRFCKWEANNTNDSRRLAFVISCFDELNDILTDVWQYFLAVCCWWDLLSHFLIIILRLVCVSHFLSISLQFAGHDFARKPSWMIVND